MPIEELRTYMFKVLEGNAPEDMPMKENLKIQDPMQDLAPKEIVRSKLKSSQLKEPQMSFEPIGEVATQIEKMKAALKIAPSDDVVISNIQMDPAHGRFSIREYCNTKLMAT